MNELSILDHGDFEFYSVNGKGIEFKSNIPIQEWLSVTQRLCGMYEGAILTQERALEMLADAMNFGEDHFGEQYAQAIDGTRAALGLSPSRIANAQWVYKKIEPSRRRERLTYSHYELIAPLPVSEQNELMDKAEAEDLSTHALKKLVVERHPLTSRGRQRTMTTEEFTEEGFRIACSRACEWLSEHEGELILEQIEKWRGPAEFFYDFFRRHWYK